MLVLRRIALGFALFCGLIASQLPEFAQQYRQRLGGAIDELTAIVDQFAAEAASQGMDASKAIAQLEANNDSLARDRGRAMTQTIERRDRLAAQKARFESAGPGARLLAFFEYVDPKIVGRAWTDFEPAAPTTGEGLATAGVGAAAGYGLARLLGTPFRTRRRKTATA